MPRLPVSPRPSTGCPGCTSNVRSVGVTCQITPRSPRLLPLVSVNTSPRRTSVGHVPDSSVMVRPVSTDTAPVPEPTSRSDSSRASRTPLTCTGLRTKSRLSAASSGATSTSSMYAWPTGAVPPAVRRKYTVLWCPGSARSVAFVRSSNDSQLPAPSTTSSTASTAPSVPL